MKGVSIASSAIVAASLFASSALAETPPIQIKGSKFFYSNNGTQFYMRGVAYQQDVANAGSGSSSANAEPQDYADPLTNPETCRRDIPYLQQLRTNIIRVYAINPEQSHDDCMRQLSDAGIYVIADLSQPQLSINRDTPSWNDDLLNRYTSVIDTMQGYDNTLGFFAGNEVANQPNNTQASAFVKAAVRDSKNYIASRGYRNIGVGYAANDDEAIVDNMALYFACEGDDPASQVDFWGYNIYSFCGDSSFEESNYREHTDFYSSYPVPVFLAEYGCNEVQPRPFNDVPVLYGPQMADVWSGGIVYMYFQEQNDYGLVEINGNSVNPLPDFTSYSSQIAQVSPTGVNMNDYNPTNTRAPACPTVGGDWLADPSPLPPTPNQELCQCMVNSLGCVVAPNTDEEQYGRLFGEVCGYDGDQCDGIAANGTAGTYGAFSMCNPTEQLSWAFGRYYQNQNRANTACNFGGSATTKQAQSPQGNCASQLQAAGSAGANPVEATPGSGSGSSSSASGSATGAAGAVTVPSLDLGLLSLGAYVIGAGLVGAGMIVL